MEDLCRTCGEVPQNSNVSNLFTDEKCVLLNHIKTLTGTWLKREINLPEYICERCQQTIAVAITFRERFNLLQNYLRYEKQKLIEKQQSTVVSMTANADEQYSINDIDPLNVDDVYSSHSEDILDEDGQATLDIKIEDTLEERLNDRHNIIIEESAMKKSTNKSVSLKGRRNADRWRQDCICEYCGKYFSCTANLKQHQLTHNGIKNHQCDTCGAKFYASYLLKRHSRLHNEVHPFVCSYCGYKFTSSMAKLRHERAHRNERPYKCAYCEKSFTSHSACKRHEVVHNGIRKHHCEICNYWTTTSNYLRHHKNTKSHKINEENQKKGTTS